MALTQTPQVTTKNLLEPNAPVLVNKSNEIIKEVIRNKIETLQLQTELGHDNSFGVGDLGQLKRQYLKWKKYLPRIEPFYAIKCNPDPMVAKYLASLGVGFDCASPGEIQKVLDIGVDTNNIIYANPCKQSSYLRYAAEQNVTMMTFDNVDELYKIKRISPKAQLVLRIHADDSKSKYPLGGKFGAPINTVDHLLQTAKDLKLNVMGVSFHVGVGCSDATAFQDALVLARYTFDVAQRKGFHCTLLDIGGGFPGIDGPESVSFEHLGATISKAVDTLFPSNVRVIAEPGRYFVQSFLIICCQIIGRRKVIGSQASGNVQCMYYVNDGLHESFVTRALYHDILELKPVMQSNVFVYDKKTTQKTYRSSVWGHTCDSHDCLAEETRLPLMEIGDWICQENIGAYAISTSHFNSFEKPRIIYIDTFTAYY
ncbi:pyridoxal-dependent decarboxylase [Fennellomyces sp. T-0311]|nr:pyridoxal-dependent decarboxylase [Fennellomyces sp. T-0311]